MAQNINYVAVINDAISHFNAIQTSLARKKVKYGSSELSASTKIATSNFSTIIDNQLSLNPSGTLVISTDKIASDRSVSTVRSSSGQGYAEVEIPSASQLGHTFSFGTSIVKTDTATDGKAYNLKGEEIDCKIHNIYNSSTVKTSVSDGWFTGDSTGKTYTNQKVATIPCISELTVKIAPTPSTDGFGALTVTDKQNGYYSVVAKSINASEVVTNFSGFLHENDRTHTTIRTEASNIYIGDVRRALFGVRDISDGKQIYCTVPGYIGVNETIDIDLDGSEDSTLDFANVIVDLAIGELEGEYYPINATVNDESTSGLWDGTISQTSLKLPKGQKVGADITSAATLTSTTTTQSSSTAAISDVETTFKVDLSTVATSHALAQVAVQGYFPAEEVAEVTHNKTTTTPTTVYIKGATYSAVTATSNDIQITSNSSSPTGYGAKVKTTTDENSVIVEASGRPRIKIKSAGHTTAANTEVDYSSFSNITTTAKIPATIRTSSNSLGTVNTTNSSISKNETTFDVGTTTVTKNASGATFTTKVSVDDSAVKDKYMIGNYKGEKTVSAQSITIPATATGSDVDDALTELLKCMHGFSYTTI